MQVKGSAFTEKKYRYINGITAALMRESAVPAFTALLPRLCLTLRCQVAGLLLVCVQLASFYEDVNTGRSQCDVGPGLLLCFDLMLYGCLTGCDGCAVHRPASSFATMQPRPALVLLAHRRHSCPHPSLCPTTRRYSDVVRWMEFFAAEPHDINRELRANLFGALLKQAPDDDHTHA